MSVEQVDVIDIIAHDPKTNSLRLIMVESRDWNRHPEAIQELDAKFTAYATFLLSGALARQCPDLAACPVCIQLEHYEAIPADVSALLRQWAGKVSAIPASVVTSRRSWNPLVNAVEALINKRRFGKSQRELVHWTPEPGFTEALLTSAKFTEEFAAALSKTVPMATIQRTGELTLTIGGEGAHQVSLHNAYNNYRITPQNKEEIIRKFVASIRESTTGSGGVEKGRIVPILKDRAWIEEVNQAMKERSPAKAIGGVHDPYNEELVIVYAQDTPTNVRYLTSDEFAGLEMDMVELRTLANANLKRLVAEPDVRLEDGLYRIRAGGDYDACVLLLEDFWDHAEIPVKGELVAAVPARDFLAVTGSNDIESVKRLRKTAEAIAAQASYRLTPKLFVRREGTFVLYDV